MAIYIIQCGNETMKMEADFRQASDTIYLDDAATPYQVATFRHSPEMAADTLMRDLLAYDQIEGEELEEIISDGLESMRVVAEYEGQLVELSGQKNPRIESARDWYENFGASIDTEREGSVQPQVFEFDSIPKLDYDSARAELQRDMPGLTDDECDQLLDMAGSIRADAESVESALEEVLDHVRAGDLDRTISALETAAQIEHAAGGASPATDDLASQVLVEVDL
jgi:hypothetical protein